MIQITVVVLGVQLVLGASLQQRAQTCVTAECFTASFYIGRGLDESVNPCDHFYNFTCGNVLAEPLPPGQILWNELQDNRQALMQKVYVLLMENSLSAPNYPSKSAELVDNLFNACINNFKIDKPIIDSMKKFLEQFGGWIAVKKACNLNWREISYKLRSFGIYSKTFLPVSIQYNLYDKTKYAVSIGAPSVVAPTSVLLNGINDQTVQRYKMNIVELAMGMGATNMTYTEQEATKIVELEIRLASLTTPGTTYEKKTIRELQKQYRSICWKTYITNMLDIEILKDKPLRYTDVAIVFQSDYLDRMFEILKSTPRSTLASYVEYRAIAEMLDIVGINIYRGAAQTAISACIPLVMQSLPVALSALYVKKYLTPELKQSLTPLVDNTKSGLVEEVDNSPWVDNETRTNVKEKISAMYELIGYPDELLDNAKVDDYYKSVQKSDNYLEFYLNISRFTDNDTFAKLREVPNRTDWSTHSSVIDSNAFYNPFENSIQILAGIITLPFYDPNRPNYVNYGTMGSIIAHEINHGVSGLGLDYDKDGLLATIATTEAVAKLNEARLCIKTQYAAMSGSEESAALTNNEDQADTVGVLAAYNAYQIWARQFGPDDSLPNYEKYTANQMFWISYGRLWCAKESSFYLSNIAPFADHSRYIFRVLGPLMNSDEFSRDFNCPSGSYMNPVKKCRIWK